MNPLTKNLVRWQAAASLELETKITFRLGWSAKSVFANSQLASEGSETAVTNESKQPEYSLNLWIPER